MKNKGIYEAVKAFTASADASKAPQYCAIATRHSIMSNLEIPGNSGNLSEVVEMIEFESVEFPHDDFAHILFSVSSAS